GTQPPHIGVACQKFKRVVEPRAGLEQQGHIAGEDGDLRRAWLVEQAEAEPAGARGLALVLDGLDRQQVQILDPRGDLGERRRRYGAVNDLAVLGERAVAEVRQRAPVSGWW